MWYGLVDPDTGDLVSVGTAAMFPNGNLDYFAGVYDRVELGGTRPDFAVKVWNRVTRQLIDRPPPIIISRLDDVESWLTSDPDWSSVWQSLSQARRTQIRAGWRRVLARLLGDQQWRGETQTVEL